MQNFLFSKRYSVNLVRTDKPLSSSEVVIIIITVILLYKFLAFNGRFSIASYIFNMKVHHEYGYLSLENQFLLWKEGERILWPSPEVQLHIIPIAQHDEVNRPSSTGPLSD